MMQGRSSLVVCLVASAVLLFAQAATALQGTDWDRYMGTALRAYQERRFTEAEEQLKAALKEAEKFEPSDSRLAESLNALAGLYSAQGKYAEAEPLYKRSLAITEKALGPEYPDVATSLNNLALLYSAQGKYAEAEPLYKRSLAILEKAVGPEHAEVAVALTALAIFYEDQERYGEAEPISKRALAIREKALGSEHPDVAQSLNGLAGIYQQLGKYEDAESLAKHSLAIREKAFGPEHEVTSRTLTGWPRSIAFKASSPKRRRCNAEPSRSERKPWDQTVSRSPKVSMVLRTCTATRESTPMLSLSTRRRSGRGIRGPSPRTPA